MLTDRRLPGSYPTCGYEKVLCFPTLLLKALDLSPGIHYIWVIGIIVQRTRQSISGCTRQAVIHMTTQGKRANYLCIRGQTAGQFGAQGLNQIYLTHIEFAEQRFFCRVQVFVALRRETIYAIGDLKMPVRGSETATGRDILAAALLDALGDALERFPQHGLAPVVAQWPRYDVLMEQPVTLETGQGPVHGTDRGIDVSGALLLAGDGGVRAYHAGEVSLRGRP